ncbi:MAG: hypothetical protein LBB05_00890 [Puniceicoccales bacterium]|jgi:hypothetical protein|nr:hypothetical protein [Puniceicoccales bacterium]
MRTIDENYEITSDFLDVPKDEIGLLIRQNVEPRTVMSLTDYLLHNVFSDARTKKLSEADAANQSMNLLVHRITTMSSAAMCYAPVKKTDEQYEMPTIDIQEMSSVGAAMAMLIISTMQNEIMLDTQLEAIKGTQNQKLSASQTKMLQVRQKIRKSRYQSPFQKFMKWLSSTWVMKFLNSNYGKAIMFLIGAAITIASFGSAGPAVIALSCVLLSFQAAELILGKSMGELITSGMSDGSAKMALQMSIDIGLMVANVGVGVASGAGKAAEQASEKVIEQATKKVMEEMAKKVTKEVAEAVAKEVGETVTKETLKAVAKEAAEKAAKEVGEAVAKEVAEEMGEEVMKKIGKEAVEAAAKKAGEAAGKAVAKEIEEELIKKVGKDMAREIANEVGQEVAKNTSEEVAKNLGKEFSEEAVQEIGEKAGKEAAQSVGKEFGENANKSFLTKGKDALIAGGRFMAGIKGLENLSSMQQTVVALQKFQQRVQVIMQVYQSLYSLAMSEEEMRKMTYAAEIEMINTKAQARQDFLQMLIDNQMSDIQSLLSYTKASFARAAEVIREYGDTSQMIARNLVI